MATDRKEGYYWVKLSDGSWHMAEYIVVEPSTPDFYLCGNDFPTNEIDLLEIKESRIPSPAERIEYFDKSEPDLYKDLKESTKFIR